MGFLIGLLVLFSAILIVLFVNAAQKRDGGSFPWVQFYLRGKESGFRFEEIGSLHKLVRRTSLRDPVSVFWSTRSLLKCIATIEKEYKEQGVLENQTNAHFLRKLYNFIARTELRRHTGRRGLRSTREIPPQQRIVLDIVGKKIIDLKHPANYTSYVIEQRPHYIAVAHPTALDNKIVKELEGDVKEITVHFAYKGDARYTFRSRILEDHSKDGTNILYLAHSRRLTRQHLRKNIRRTLNVSGEVFLDISPKDIKRREMYEHEGGFRCQVIDVSEGGLAIIVGGHVTVRQALKIQLVVDQKVLVYIAEVIAVERDRDQQLVLARLQAVLPSVQMRNRISSIIHDIPNVSTLTTKQKIKKVRGVHRRTGGAKKGVKKQRNAPLRRPRTPNATKQRGR